MKLYLGLEDTVNVPYKTSAQYNTLHNPKNNAETSNREINGQIFKWI